MLLIFTASASSAGIFDTAIKESKVCSDSNLAKLSNVISSNIAIARDTKLGYYQYTTDYLVLKEGRTYRRSFSGKCYYDLAMLELIKESQTKADEKYRIQTEINEQKHLRRAEIRLAKKQAADAKRIKSAQAKAKKDAIISKCMKQSRYSKKLNGNRIKSKKTYNKIKNKTVIITRDTTTMNMLGSAEFIYRSITKCDMFGKVLSSKYYKSKSLY